MEKGGGLSCRPASFMFFAFVVRDRGILRYFVFACLNSIADVGQLRSSEGSHVAVPRRICKKYTIILQGAAEYITADTKTSL